MSFKQLYYTRVCPYLNYGVSSWGSACKTRLTGVLTKQSRCVRCNYSLLAGRKILAFTMRFEILELNNIGKLRIALFAHKIQNDT